MPEAASLERPTNRDEAWRYADAGYLAEAELAALADWQELHVVAGETREDTRIVSPGVERLRVHVGKGARFAMFALNAAGPYARLEVEVKLEDRAHFEFGGVTVGGGHATQEFVTRTIHAEPNATSNQTVRAVHWGKSSGNFLGRIEVVKDAQKTDAAQNFCALLLEKGATANTKPELEIFADDVQCAHGAAIGQMDEMARYYMAARGIPPEAARKLLVQAFIGDAFVEMSDPEAAERMLEAALAHLDEAAI
jgi:Fe-S cluster assembly protein SufD